MSKKYAILIVRVSTMVQDYEPQIEDLKKYAKDKGYTDFHIIPTKESGLIDLNKKEGTNSLFSFIEENPQYKVVFLTEISRLGRRQSVLHQIKEWLVKNGVQLFVKDIGYSLLDENGKVSIGGDMMFSMYGLFAETEINQKKERFSRAKKSLMEQGLSISGKTLFGYKRIVLGGIPKRTTLEIDENSAEKVRMLFNWYLNGIDVYEKKVSIKRIALECIKLGFPKYTHSKRNINKLLKEDGYTGYKVTNNKRKNINYKEGGNDEKYLVTNNIIKYPPIIDKETFNSVQERLLQNNSRIDKSTKNITILSKLIKCSKCENHYGGNYRVVKSRNVDTYRCNSRTSIGFCNNNQSISMSMLDSSVWCLIKTDLGTLSKVISKFNPDVEILKLKESIIELEKRRDEIDEEMATNLQSLKGYSRLKNISTLQFQNQILSKVTKLDKEKGEIDNELTKMRYNLSVNNIEIDDSYKLIKKNINSIEESKDMIKKYINLFIGSIEIILHNSRYSIIKVKYSTTIIKMKIHGHIMEMTQQKKLKDIIDDSGLELDSYIILDKNHSQDIRTYKSNKSIYSSPIKDTILIGSKNITKGIRISLDEVGSKVNKPYFKEFDFNKLTFY